MGITVFRQNNTFRFSAKPKKSTGDYIYDYIINYYNILLITTYVDCRLRVNIGQHQIIHLFREAKFDVKKM